MMPQAHMAVSTTPQVKASPGVLKTSPPTAAFDGDLPCTVNEDLRASRGVGSTPDGGYPAI